MDFKNINVFNNLSHVEYKYALINIDDEETASNLIKTYPLISSMEDIFNDMIENFEIYFKHYAQEFADLCCDGYPTYYTIDNENASMRYVNEQIKKIKKDDDKTIINLLKEYYIKNGAKYFFENFFGEHNRGNVHMFRFILIGGKHLNDFIETIKFEY